MEIVGKEEITQNMIDIRKRELNAERKKLQSELKARTKECERMEKAEIETNAIRHKINQLERKIGVIDCELKFYSAQYQPVRLFDIVINYKLLKSILQKTKKFNINIQKGEGDTVEIAWDGKGSQGKYTLNNLASFYKNIIYIPELIVQE